VCVTVDDESAVGAERVAATATMLCASRAGDENDENEKVKKVQLLRFWQSNAEGVIFSGLGFKPFTFKNWYQTATSVNLSDASPFLAHLDVDVEPNRR
jgi:hypothetical protein